MSESKLREALAELVADVDAPPMAQQAWRNGQRSRRRLAVGSAAAGVLVIAAGVVVANGGLGSSGPDAEVGIPTVSPYAGRPAPLAPAPGNPNVQAAPERGALAALPTLSTRFAPLSSVPSSAEALSRRPVWRIVAAVQPVDAPVFVLGADGAWRYAGGLGGAGAQVSRLTSTSISPDARRLALVHSDGVLLVDATTGRSRLLPVPEAFGRVDNLRWLSDGNRIAVSGDLGSGVVLTSDGRFERTDEPMQDLAVSHPGAPIVHMGRSELVVKDAATTVRRRYGTGDQIMLDQWYGGRWVNGSSAASTGFLGGAGHDGEQAILVVEVGTARVTHVLTLPTGGPPAVRSNGCCETLGWLDEHTVLLRDGGQVLAWRFTSGAVYRVARLAGTRTHGTDPGGNSAIALAQP